MCDGFASVAFAKVEIVREKVRVFLGGWSFSALPSCCFVRIVSLLWVTLTFAEVVVPVAPYLVQIVGLLLRTFFVIRSCFALLDITPVNKLIMFFF